MYSWHHNDSHQLSDMMNIFKWRLCYGSSS